MINSEIEDASDNIYSITPYNEILFTEDSIL